jgi:hypothetical protein
MAPISFGRSEVRFSGEFGSGSRGSPWSLEVKLSGELGSRARASFGVFEVGFRSSSGARRPYPSGFGRSLLSDDGPTGSERGGRRRWDALRSTPTSTPLAAEDVGALADPYGASSGFSEPDGGSGIRRDDRRRARAGSVVVSSETRLGEGVGVEVVVVDGGRG